MSNDKCNIGILRHISIAAVLLLALYVWRSPLLALLLAVQNMLLGGVDQLAFAALLMIVGISLSFYICIDDKRYIPRTLFVYSLPFVISYVCCRAWAEDLSFWGEGNFVYTDILLMPWGLGVLMMLAGVDKPLATNELASDVEPYVLRDDPIERAEDDILGYSNLVTYLYNDLRSADLSKGSFSVGIAASWGKGKTSYMKLFQEKAEDKKEGNIVVWFNPRASKRVEDIQEDFFRQFSEVLAKYHFGFSIVVNRYLSALGLLEGGAWLTAGLHLFRTLSAVGEKDRINRAIDNIGKNIYVFVDDLDRLTGAEILETFKIIDKNADFHRTIFMTGYDKAYVNVVLAQHLGLDTSIDYTDKYFNLEVSLPEISSKQLAVFAHQYIEEWIKTFDEQLEIDTTLDAWNRVSLKVVPHLDSLRHIKRYTNLFLSRYSRVVGNIEPEDFMLLTLLRYKDIQIYNALSRGRFVERGGGFLSGTRKLLYNCLSKDDTRTEFEKLATWGSAKQIIETLFPPLPADENRDELVKDRRSITDVYRRICMVDYFPLYFYDQLEEVIYHKGLLPLFSVPEEEVPGFITRLFEGDQMDRLEDFLNYKSAEEIATLEDLQRLCLSLTYFLQKDNRYSVVFMLLRLYSYMDYVSELISKIGTTKEQYKGALDQVLSDMVEIAPWEISNYVLSVMMRNSDGLYTPQECLDWILRCQKAYYENVWGTDAWSYDQALIFGQITQIDGEGLVPEAREVLVAMMEEHPDEFARELFIIIEKTIETQYEIIFRRSFPPDKIFSEGAITFEQWLDQVSDEKLKYILLLIYRNTVVSKGSIWLPIEGEWPSGEEEVDWLYMQLSTAYSAVPFVAGDYVRLRNAYFDMNFKDRGIANVFEVVAVNNEDGSLRLDSVDRPVEVSQVMPIPIDGESDAGFYYLSINLPLNKRKNVQSEGQEYTYYMDALKYFGYNDRTVYDAIKKDGLKFVHEVQHWLREHIGEDKLRSWDIYPDTEMLEW